MEFTPTFDKTLLESTKWGKWIPETSKDFDRKRTSFILERRMMIAHMMENAQRTGACGKLLQEDIPSTLAATNTNKMVLPIIRKMMAQLVAYDIATVQPLIMPNGYAFIQTLIANRARGNVASGADLLTSFSRNYSSDYVVEEPAETGDAVRTKFSGNLLHTPVRPYNASYDYSVVITDGTETFTDDGEGVLTGSEGGTGTIDYTTGAWSVTFNAAPGNGDAIVASYSQNMEGSSDVGEVSFSYETVQLHSKERRLRMTIPETTIEDMLAQLGISAEAEFVSYIAQYMATEIDREIVQAQINAAEEVNVTYSPASSAVELEAIRNLLTRFSNASADVAVKTNIGPSNYMIMPPAVVALLEQLGTHSNYRNIFVRENAGPFDGAEPANLLPSSGTGGRVMRVGTLQNKWAIYQDPLMSRNQSVKDVLLGLRGDSYYQSGTIYAPYVPLTFSSTMEDVDTATRKKALRTRYALKVHRPEFYKVFHISGLENFS